MESHDIILSPNVNPLVDQFLSSQKNTLFSLMDAFGSPLHILFPQIFTRNVAAYQNILSKTHIDGKIYFACKANKSKTFLEMSSHEKIGVEVSSIHELKQALSHGIKGEDIIVSGPVKNVPFLLLGIIHDCLISIDDFIELRSIAAIIEKQTNNKKVKILLRINDITENISHFGIPILELKKVYQFLQETKTINLTGFSFHINNYSIEDRTTAIKIIINEIHKLHSYWFRCDTIDIGGGFTIEYVQEEQWNNFLKQVNKSLFFASKNFTSFYPYFNQYPKEKFLNKILLSKIKGQKFTLKDKLKQEGLKLIIEPGRSLLDQCGVTLMRITAIKKLSSGDNIIFVDANINHLSEQWFNSEFLVDPVLISKLHKENGKFIASIAGNLCLEQDMISWRKIQFNQIPREDDILVYINTAGYQMDSNESSFQQIPIPEKISVYKLNNQWFWKLDKRFSQLDLIGINL